MKQNFKILALLVIGFCAFQNVFGQINSEDNKKFRDLFDKSQTFLRASTAYRIRSTAEVFTDNGKTLKSKITAIREYAAPDRSYYSTTVETGGKTTKLESIRIGEQIYIRKDNGKWEIPEEEKTRSMAGVGMSSGAKLIERTTFQGNVVEIYEESSSVSIGDNDAEVKARFWLTEDGRLLKKETERIDSQTNELTREVAVYEYDAKVKIEAPAI